jgi:hypothetical protein
MTADDDFTIAIERWSGRLFRLVAAGFVVYWVAVVLIHSLGGAADPQDRADAVRYIDGPNIDVDAK